MSAGHRHRTVKVRRGGRVHRWLTEPTLGYACERQAEASRYIWGPVSDSLGVIPGLYRLSPLGLLHGLVGLTLWVQPEESAGTREAEGGAWDD